MGLNKTLTHLKNHISYPANRDELVKACNNMSDVSKEDREWFADTIPKGSYESPEGVVKALFTEL